MTLQHDWLAKADNWPTSINTVQANTCENAALNDSGKEGSFGGRYGHFYVSFAAFLTVYIITQWGIESSLVSSTLSFHQVGPVFFRSISRLPRFEATVTRYDGAAKVDVVVAVQARNKKVRDVSYITFLDGLMHGENFALGIEPRMDRVTSAK